MAADQSGLIRKIRQMVFFFLFLCFGVFGCGFQYIDRAAPPEEAYWSKDGYTIDMTRDFLYRECYYSKANVFESFEEYVYRMELCMLENGFKYMEDAYDVTSRGFAPLRKSRCREGSYLFDLPACRSLRGLSWNKISHK